MFVITGSNGSKAEERLWKTLFSTYNSAARPVINDKDAINVTLGMTLYQVVDVVSESIYHTTTD